jgi:hypothetical protein
LFRKNLTRIQTSSHEKIFPKPNLFCPAWHSLRDICHMYQVPAQPHKNKISSFVNLSCHLKKQMNQSSTLEQLKLRGNATVRRLTCSVAWELSFSVFRELRCNCITVSLICAAPFSSTCSTQSDNNCRKLRLPVSLVCPRPKRSFIPFTRVRLSVHCGSPSNQH